MSNRLLPAEVDALNGLLTQRRVLGEVVDLCNQRGVLTDLERKWLSLGGVKLASDAKEGAA